LSSETGLLTFIDCPQTQQAQQEPRCVL
jgi:hypothetical protein